MSFTTANIFVSEAAKASKSKKFVGVRFDNQIIPSGCYAVGMMFEKAFVIDRPLMTDEQEVVFDAAIKYAADGLNDEWLGDEHYPAML